MDTVPQCFYSGPDPGYTGPNTLFGDVSNVSTYVYEYQTLASSFVARLALDGSRGPMTFRRTGLGAGTYFNDMMGRNGTFSCTSGPSVGTITMLDDDQNRIFRRRNFRYNFFSQKIAAVFTFSNESYAGCAFPVMRNVLASQPGYQGSAQTGGLKIWVGGSFLRLSLPSPVFSILFSRRALYDNPTSASVYVTPETYPSFTFSRLS
jgi:hypothetical protein